MPLTGSGSIRSSIKLMVLSNGTRSALLFCELHKRKAFISLRLLLRLLGWPLCEHYSQSLLPKIGSCTKWMFIMNFYLVIYMKRSTCVRPQISFFSTHDKFVDWKSHCMDFIRLPGAGFRNSLLHSETLVLCSPMLITPPSCIMLVIYSCVSQIYVDDLLITSTSLLAINKFKLL